MAGTDCHLPPGPVRGVPTDARASSGQLAVHRSARLCIITRWALSWVLSQRCFFGVPARMEPRAVVHLLSLFPSVPCTSAMGRVGGFQLSLRVEVFLQCPLKVGTAGSQDTHVLSVPQSPSPSGVRADTVRSVKTDGRAPLRSQAGSYSPLGVSSLLGAVRAGEGRVQPSMDIAQGTSQTNTVLPSVVIKEIKMAPGVGSMVRGSPVLTQRHGPRELAAQGGRV